MKLKVGIVGLLIILVVVLVMTRPRSDPSREGYGNGTDDSMDIALLMLLFVFGPMTLILIIGKVLNVTGVITPLSNGVNSSRA